MSELEEACRHLLNVWHQYGTGLCIEGRLYLGHQQMRAGQEAGGFLIARGYATDYGEGILVTEAGETLMQEEPRI